MAPQLCRICMKSGGFLFNLFRPTSGTTVAGTISSLANVEIGLDDGLPQCVCSSCVREIEAAKKLIEKCKESDRQLREMFRNDIIEGDIIKEPVSDEPTYHVINAIEEIKVVNVTDEDCDGSDGDGPIELLDIDDIIEEETFDSEGVNLTHDGSSGQETDAACVEELIMADPLAQVAEGRDANLTQCCGCVENFSSFEELQEHSRTHHRADKAICGPAPDNLIECNICFKMFSGISYLDSMHRLNAFKNRLTSVGFPEVMQCCSCEALCSTKQELLEHAVQQHLHEKLDPNPAQPFECEYCFKQYNQKAALGFHQKFSYSYKKLLRTKRRGCKAIRKRGEFEGTTTDRKCCGCTAVFPSEDNLRQHSQMHHELYRRQTDAGNPYECDICFKQFPTLIRLEQHKVVPYTRVHKCDQCNKSFVTAAMLETHRKRHGDGQQPGNDARKQRQPVQCEQCGKVFPGKSALRQHTKCQHSREKPFSCSLCFRKFKWKQTLQNHLRLHTKEQPYGCGFCPRTFTQVTDKNRHELSHNKMFPLRCPVCNKGFPAGRRKQLEKHQLLHESGEEYPLTCQFCDRTFTRLVQRNRHQARHVAERDRNLQLKLREIGIA